VLSLDFSRFRGLSVADGSKRGGWVATFALGAVAALLAGACVAPVLISVLLLSADLYTRGNGAGLLLPFLLGIGMALPWPFAGGGLSFLPKPGKWMEKVKMALGVLILAFAAWYGYLGYSLFRDRAESTRALAGQESQAHEGWLTTLDEAMNVAARDKKPVLIDFWASWCKNCLRMEETTFRDESVRQRLGSYVKVKYRAEDVRDNEVKATLDRFGAIGLPTYVVLLPSSP
jgi:thioredoxin:protein disulfide reductase